MKRREEKIRSMRDWYMEGFEMVDQFDPKSGKMKKKENYIGLYYKYDVENIRKYKAGVLIGVLIYMLITAAAWCIPGKNIWYSWTGAVSLVLIIPIMYMVIGIAFFLGQKIPLTVRQTYSGYWRIIRSFNVQFWMECAVIICFIVEIIINGGIAGFTEVLPMLIFLAGVIYLLIFRKWMKKYPPEA